MTLLNQASICSDHLNFKSAHLDGFLELQAKTWINLLYIFWSTSAIKNRLKINFLTVSPAILMLTVFK